MQDFLFALVRLVHVVGAVIWVGMAFGMSAFVFPAILKGNNFAFLKELFLGTFYRFAFPTVSIVTTLAGVTLFLLGAINDFTRLGRIVLVIGATSGVLAFLHGAISLGSLQRQMILKLKDSDTIPGGGDSKSYEALKDVLAKDSRHGIISLWLTSIALIFMGLARFF